MAGDKRTVDYFRTDCLRALIKISQCAWPDLNYSTGKGELVLRALGFICAAHAAS